MYYEFQLYGNKELIPFVCLCGCNVSVVLLSDKVLSSRYAQGQKQLGPPESVRNRILTWSDDTFEPSAVEVTGCTLTLNITSLALSLETN